MNVKKSWILKLRTEQRIPNKKMYIGFVQNNGHQQSKTILPR